MFETKTPDELSSTPLNGESYRYHCNRYIVNANAEIDRLNDELAALRSQPAVERAWISSETHESHVSVEAGIYMRVHRETGNVAAIFCESGDALPVTAFDYTLILAEVDFPVPPKPELAPLEAKVGKYDVPERGTAEVLRIIGDKCWYVNTMGNHSIEAVVGVRSWLILKNATFIGEGDNQ